MKVQIRGLRVAFVTANEGVEEIEFTRPWEAVRQAGGEPFLLAPEPGDVQMMDHLDRADRFLVDRTLEHAHPADYDALVLPGGVANPDRLRLDRRAVDLVAAMFPAGRPLAAICHAPWTLIEADVVRGRTLTSWPSLRTDIRNAGGSWLDEQVVVCGSGPNVLVTSRKPDDLDVFCPTLLDQFARADTGART
jgi:protease I